METVKLHRLSRIRVPKGEDSPDSIVRSKAINMGDRARGQQILLEAQAHYMAAEKFREERERNKKYTYGNQLDDIVNVDGVPMTEEEYIKRQGGVPLTMNLIQKHLRGVVGTFREQNSEPMCVARDRDEQQEAETLSVLLQYNMQLNQMSELYADGMRDFTIGGGIIHKKTVRWRNERLDCWTDKVPFDAFIPDSNMRDLRGWDCTFVGQIHDYNFNTLCAEYADSPENYKRLMEIYGCARKVYSGVYTWNQFGFGNNSVKYDFLTPTDANRCRVIEVWRKETKPRMLCHDWNNGTIYKIDPEDYPVMVEAENQRRMVQAAQAGIPKDEVPLIEMVKWFVDSFWYNYFLSPFGDIIKEGETEYDHKSHPFVFKFYPFLDGEIHSFVSDLVPLQRYTNRLVMLNDMILRSTAKGLLVVPRKALKGGLTEGKIGKIWAKPNGVLVVDSVNKDEMPFQIASNMTNIGIHDMLAMNLKFFDDIGINGSLQGKTNYAGESGTHAQMMAQNAATSLVDLLESFKAFECEAAYKDVKNIQQYYDEKKVMDIVGRTAKGGSDVNPQKVLNTEVDVSIAQGKKTPSYKALANEFFLNLFNQQAISVEQLLESVVDIPGAEELLQNIRSQRQQAEQGQMPEGISPELLHQVQAGLNPNPKAMDQLNQAVYGGE
jgi:hypothetical protein